MRRRIENMNYFGGMLCGVAIGMMLTRAFLPKDAQKLLSAEFDLLAWFCLGLGLAVATLMPKMLPKSEAKEKEEVAEQARRSEPGNGAPVD